MTSWALVALVWFAFQNGVSLSSRFELHSLASFSSGVEDSLDNESRTPKKLFTCEDMLEGLYLHMSVLTHEMQERAATCSGNNECLRDEEGRVTLNQHIVQEWTFLHRFIEFQRLRIRLGDPEGHCRREFERIYTRFAPQHAEALQTVYGEASEFKWLGTLGEAPSDYIQHTRQHLSGFFEAAAGGVEDARPSVSWLDDPQNAQAWWTAAKEEEPVTNAIQWWVNADETERREVDAVIGIRYPAITVEDAALDAAETLEEQKADQNESSLDVGVIRATRRSLQKPHRWCWAMGTAKSHCHSKKKRSRSGGRQVVHRACFGISSLGYDSGKAPASLRMQDIRIATCEPKTPGHMGGRCVRASTPDGHAHLQEIRQTTGDMVWGICLHKGDGQSSRGPLAHLARLQQEEHEFEGLIQSVEAEAASASKEGRGRKKRRHRRHGDERHHGPREGSKQTEPQSFSALQLAGLTFPAASDDLQNELRPALVQVAETEEEKLEALRSRFVLGWLRGLGRFAVSCVGAVVELVAAIGTIAVKVAALSVNVVPWLFLQTGRAVTIPLKWIKMNWLRKLMFLPFCSVLFKATNFIKDGFQWLLESIFRLFQKLGAMMTGVVYQPEYRYERGALGILPFGTRKLLWGCCDEDLDGGQCCEEHPECCPDYFDGQRLPYERPLSNSFNPLDVCADVNDFYKKENVVTDAQMLAGMSEEDRRYIERARRQLQKDEWNERNSFYPGKAENSGGVWTVTSQGYTMIPDKEYKKMMARGKK